MPAASLGLIPLISPILAVIVPADEGSGLPVELAPLARPLAAPTCRCEPNAPHDHYDHKRDQPPGNNLSGFHLRVIPLRRQPLGSCKGREITIAVSGLNAIHV